MSFLATYYTCTFQIFITFCIGFPSWKLLKDPKVCDTRIFICHIRWRTLLYTAILVYWKLCVCVPQSLSSVWVLRPHGLQPTRLLSPLNFPGKNTEAGCHFLLQGIFPTQGSNLCLLHWQTDSLPLELPGKPCWKVYWVSNKKQLRVITLLETFSKGI